MTEELSPSQTPPQQRTSSPLDKTDNTSSQRNADPVTSNGGHGRTRLGDAMSTPSPGMDSNERGRIRSSASPHTASTPNDSHDGHYQHGENAMHGQGQGQENALRVEKRRRAGGFLLPSALRHTPGSRRHHRDDERQGKGKEKASAGNGAVISSSTTPVRSNGTMRSSPLAQVVVSPRPKSYVDGTAGSRPSTELGSRPTSEASSTQPRPSSDYTLGPDGSVFGQQNGGGIDAAQIVSMALNLSEGRRRHMSAGQLLQQQASGARRSTSIAMPSPGMLQGSFQNAGTGMGGAMRQALSQQKGRSRNNSPGSQGKGTPKRHTSNALPFLSPETAGANYAGTDMFYRFSPSTLARAEKARQYIELSVEYRRLLDYLPPLRPDASASGNYEYITHSVPGSPFVELVRSPTTGPRDRHELGRRYNPLQMIRNRKMRMRNRIELKPDVEHFTDVNVVRDWIDEVENMSSRPGYRTEDKVHLPLYPEHGNGMPQSPEALGHQRNESTTKPKHQRTDWSFHPSEHVADAHWMELDGHKRMIENHLGNKVFPPLVSHDNIQPRASYESRRSHRSLKGSTGTSVGSYEIPPNDSDSEKDSVRQGHRHRHHLHLHRRDESRGRLKHAWRKARRRSRSSSSNLSSSDEGPMGERARSKPGGLRVTSGGHNISALEKHMDSRLQAQAQEKSPDLVSPGTPNKWGTTSAQVSILQREVEGKGRHSDSDRVPSDSVVKDYGKQDRKLTPDSFGRGRGRFQSQSSFEEYSTTPNSPITNPHVPPITLEPSPGGSRTGSPSRLGKPLLPFIRNEKKNNQRKGSAEDGYQSSRQTSAEVTSNPRGSLEIPVPTTPERVKLHRHKTSDGISGLTGTDRENKDTKEPQSAVRRFLKGGRIGEIVRNEGKSRMRKRGSLQDDSGLTEIGNTESDTMEESDTEETDTNAFKEKPSTLQRSNTGWSQKYNSDKLPAFRSAKANGHGRRGSDHISMQQLERQQSRPSRFDSLAPPELDLTRINSSSSNFADLSRETTKASDSPRADRRNAQGFAQHNRNRSRLGMRLEAILDVPGTVGSGGLPVTGLADIANEKPPARPGLKDKRQWSISDRHRSQSRDPRAPSLDYFEIARVRALLMCSGIKATTIERRGNEPRFPVPEFLMRAAETCNTTVKVVKRSEEHVLAAKLLTTHLESETSALHDDSDRFLQETAKGLKKDLTEIRETVDTAIKRAQNLGDVCVGFGSEVTGQRTLQVRQVVDQLDKLARARRRRLRWLRRLGFGMGEWLVVLLLWSAWFLVVIIKTVWAIVSGVGKAVKWVLWL